MAETDLIESRPSEGSGEAAEVNDQSNNTTNSFITEKLIAVASQAALWHTPEHDRGRPWTPRTGLFSRSSFANG